MFGKKKPSLPEPTWQQWSRWAAEREYIRESDRRAGNPIQPGMDPVNDNDVSRETR